MSKFFLYKVVRTLSFHSEKDWETLLKSSDLIFGRPLNMDNLFHFKFAFGFVTLLTIGVGSVLSQQNCVIEQCTQTLSAANLADYPLPEVQNTKPDFGAPNFNRPRRQASDYNAPPAGYETPSYNAPPPSYEALTQPPKVLNPGRVVVMPPPGKAPQGFPQPGQPGGGALPETNPYIANMAPDGTVPIAIFPPFEKNPLYPTKCVIYSQLTDFEDLEINDYGNIQVDQVNIF